MNMFETLKNKIQQCIKHIKTMFYTLLAVSLKKDTIISIEGKIKNFVICLNFIINETLINIHKIMRRLEEIKERIYKKYKYYPWIFAKPLVWIPISSSVLIHFFGESNSILELLSKLFIGFSISQILLELNGHSDTIKILRRLSEIHLTLERWKQRLINNDPINLNDIQYLSTGITSTQSEYSKKYDILNIEEEKKYIESIKERIENEDNVENKTILGESLIDHIEELEKQGFTDIRSVTGTTKTYFSNVISPTFMQLNRRERREIERQNKKKK